MIAFGFGFDFEGCVEMRKFGLAAAILGLLSTAAQAADLPVLRGGYTEGVLPSRSTWQGSYVGVQGGYGAADARMGSANQALLADVLRNSAVEQALQVSTWTFPQSDGFARSAVYGVFGGYNSQWDDVVLGLEASYVHGRFNALSTASMGRSSTAPDTSTPPLYYGAGVKSMAGISLTDMATFRGRAGYAYGAFLPYLFGGFALGNADIDRSVSVAVSASTSTLGPFVPQGTVTGDGSLHSHLVYGYALGVGVDMQLSGNLFLRAEYEYVRFLNQVDTAVNTARLGLGYRF